MRPWGIAVRKGAPVMMDTPLRWVYPDVPIAAQQLVAIEVPACQRVEVGLLRWLGLRPGPMAPLPMDPGPRGEARRSAVDGNSERVEYFDPVRRLGYFELSATAGLVFELTRAQIPSHATAVLERVATWLRIAAVREGVVDPPVEFFEGPTVVPILTNASPFPFPLVHPDGGELRAEWCVVRQRFGDTSGQPPLVAGGTPAEIPADLTLVGPWRDMRYRWGSQYGDGNNWVFGARSLLRLFVTFTVIGAGRWYVDAAGRLGGFYQHNGTLGAGLEAAITRH